jgi:hypothetical protein
MEMVAGLFNNPRTAGRVSTNPVKVKQTLHFALYLLVQGTDPKVFI